jgi:hypothetical protein
VVLRDPGHLLGAGLVARFTLTVAASAPWRAGVVERRPLDRRDEPPSTAQLRLQWGRVGGFPVVSTYAYSDSAAPDGSRCSWPVRVPTIALAWRVRA